MGDWNEKLHPRDGEGQFTRAGVDAWVGRVSVDIARRRSEPPPAGHAEAARRALELWKVPGLPGRTERTDAEQDELNALEGAFDTYRNHLGLQHDSGVMYHDGQGGKYNEYGEYLGRNVSDDRPLAARLGYRRVGEHPQGAGRINGEHIYWSPSTHPDAGGLWINPARPGSRHEPNYLNDMGHGISELRKPKSRSQREKEHVLGFRRGEYRTSPDDAERVYRRVRPATSAGRTVMIRRDWEEGRFGYGARADLHDDEGLQRANVFVAAMKRVQARGRQENARAPKRRTLRGTQVEGWMDQASAQLARRAGRG